MHKILIVVDMQNDFISGSLGTIEAKAILPKMVAKIKTAQKEGAKIMYTLDTHNEHYLETQEGRNLPIPHCVKGEAGWELAPELSPLLKEAVPYTKDTFGSKLLVEDLVTLHKKNPIAEIELCGLCTDICVISNALIIKAFLPEVLIAVDASCSAGVTPQSHATALAAMKACQIQILNFE